MTHRFPIKEIARQAGLGPATVDRVLNNRAHVSPQTKLRVTAAITELEGQEAQLAARGRRLFFDFVIEAPTRFNREVRQATEAVLPRISTAVCRPRFIHQDIMQEDDVITTLAQIAKRGSHGICLKARDTPKIRQAVNNMGAAGIPVVTLVTDIAGTSRQAYVGLDNAGAGRTAAYLVEKFIADQSGTVLASRSHEQFLGEEEREIAFAAELAVHCPNLQIVTVQGGGGVDFETSKVLSGVIDVLPDLRAVYSMGGGNHTILKTLAHHGLRPKVFVAHDLDVENRELLQNAQLDFVLHHDLQTDIQNAFNVFLSFHRLAVDPPVDPISTVQVLTPRNIP